MATPSRKKTRVIAGTVAEGSDQGVVSRDRMRSGGLEGAMVEQEPAEAAPQDAGITAVISDSGLEARVKEYRPPQEDGRELAVDDVEAALRHAGVVVKPDREHLEKVVARLRKESDAPDLVLVRGRPPEEPVDATVEPVGDLGKPVTPGALIAKRIPPKPGMPGRGVDGREIPPKLGGRPKDLDMFSETNCRLDERQGVVVSEAYGMARFVDGKLWVDPLLEISQDQIEVVGDIHPKDHQGRPISVEAILSDLSRLRIGVPPQKNTISSAVNRAQKSNKPQAGILAAKGMRPEDGKDGWLEILVRGRTGKAAVRDDGRVDHRDKGVYPSVEPGMEVARLHPPTMGLPGTDVFGKPIPAKRGAAIKVAAGQNVEALEEGKLFRSKEGGIVVHQGGVLSVTECLDVHGDVDYATGNIEVERGSVKIAGALLSGFSVVAPEHVLVGDVIESARVRAGKDVEIRGGVLMPDGGLIKAGGRVICQFASNANIEAEGDVIVAHNISNCNIQTRGRVINSKGKGIIQGGHIVCARGLDTNEIGSDLGVETTIMVSLMTDESRELLDERKSLAEQVEKINGAVGTEDPKTCLLRTPEPKRKAVAELLKVRIGAQQRIEEIDNILAEREQRHLKELGSVRIVVRRVAWPGTIIKIGGRTYKVKTAAKACRFYWEKESQSIVVGNLR